MTSDQRFLFIMFSSTPSKMGQFIRRITKNKYNHVSLCIDVEGVTLYSFARKYKRHPFYGGFVRESSLRFIHNNKFADIKLCAIPVSNLQYEIVKDLLQMMESNKEAYVYNHFSAIGTIVNKRVTVKNAYTCVEFITSVLSIAGIISVAKSQKICAIKDLENLLEGHAIYEGTFEQMAFQINNVGDKFAVNKKLYIGTFKAFYSNSKLLYSLLRSTI